MGNHVSLHVFTYFHLIINIGHQIMELMQITGFIRQNTVKVHVKPHHKPSPLMLNDHISTALE